MIKRALVMIKRVIGQIPQNSRISRKFLRSEWGFHYFRVSSDRIILGYRVIAFIFSSIENIFRDLQAQPSSTTGVYYTISFKSSILISFKSSSL